MWCSIQAVLTSALVLCVLRYQPWLDGNLAGKPIKVACWDTPASGPVTFFGIVCLFCSGCLFFTSKIREATLLAAFGGWIFTFLAAAVIISGATWSLLPIDNYTVAELANKLSLEVPAGEVADSKVQLGAAWACWASYFFGLTTAASAIWVLSNETRPKTTVAEEPA